MRIALLSRLRVEIEKVRLEQTKHVLATRLVVVTVDYRFLGGGEGETPEDASTRLLNVFCVRTAKMEDCDQRQEPNTTEISFSLMLYFVF